MSDDERERLKREYPNDPRKWCEPRTRMAGAGGPNDVAFLFFCLACLVVAMLWRMSH